MNQSEAISIYHPLLCSIAFKIVGRLEDAEDIVQDTFEKWLTIDHEKIQNTKPYLIRSVSNNSLSFLTSFKNKVSHKTSSTDQHYDLADLSQIKTFFNFDLDAQLGEAWQILHKKLEPLEKSIYIMREVFNLEYDELQEIFDKKKDHCRQLFFRAKNKLAKDKIRLKKEFSKPILPDSFKKACDFGNFNDIIEDFKRDIPKKLPLRK